MPIPMYQEAIYHCLAGIAISFADRLFSRNAKRHTEERMKEKMGHAEALKYLVDADQGEGDVSNGEYLANMVRARDFFRDRGKKIKRDELNGLKEKLKDTVNHYRENERINTQPFAKQFMIAFGLEFVIDAFVAISQALGAGVNALGALGESLYQGPCLFAGFLIGEAGLYFKGIFRSKEEKELDSILADLTRDGKLLEKVRAFKRGDARKDPQPTEEDKADSLKDKVGDAVGKVTDAVKGGVASAINKQKAKGEAQEKAEAKRQSDLKSRYDDY